MPGLGDDDFAMASFGRDKNEGPIGGADYGTGTPEGGMYTVSGMTSFNNDLVAWNGSWIAGPRTNVRKLISSLILTLMSRGGGTAAPFFARFLPSQV